MLLVVFVRFTTGDVFQGWWEVETFGSGDLRVRGLPLGGSVGGKPYMWKDLGAGLGMVTQTASLRAVGGLSRSFGHETDPKDLTP